MATTSALGQGIPVPEPTDADNVPFAMSQAIAPIESRLNMRFASAAARDAAITTPVAGMRAYLTDTGRTSVYTGSAWIVVEDPGAWQTWTPSWTGAGGTNPTVGNASVVARFRQVGRVCSFLISLTTGSTSNFSVATGALVVSLPVNAANIGADQVCNALAFDTSSGLYYRGVGRIGPNGNTIGRTYFADAVTGPNGWNATVPFAWAPNGDQVLFSGTYETV